MQQGCVTITQNKKISIYVDADACPVKDEILKVSYRHQLNVYLVSNQWMRMEVGPLVQKIVVSEGADEADNWIVDQIDQYGIAITADIPLAKRCLDKGASVICPVYLGILLGDGGQTSTFLFVGQLF